MEKRRVLRKWVVDLLITITCLIICILTAEFESLMLQGIFTLVGGFCVCMNVKIIKKWGFVERFVD